MYRGTSKPLSIFSTCKAVFVDLADRMKLRDGSKTESSDCVRSPGMSLTLEGDPEFGELDDDSHKFECCLQPESEVFKQTKQDQPPSYIILTTYLGLLILVTVGRIRDFFGKLFKEEAYRHFRIQNGYAPLYSDYDNFYTRRIKRRLDDCLARPCVRVPGRYITLLERTSDDFNRTFRLTGRTIQCLNMSSYNYLGFAQSNGICADEVDRVIRSHGLSYSSPIMAAGTSDLLCHVENQIAAFVGKESALICSMGFQTNCSALPVLVSEGCLIISDELNHASLRVGARLSRASIRPFRHNDMKDLEHVLRSAIANGQPRTLGPWRKILVIVEGIYSMEGTFCNLPGIVALKKRYKFYLFIDEAHSIGAIGPQGRGVCDYFGVNPSEVDILMGTFSKSFGAVGGYIAGDKELIAKLRMSSADCGFGEAPCPPVLKQISSVVDIMTQNTGQERLQRLAFNSRYLRLGLKRLGFIVYGGDDSPVVPLLMYNTGKILAFSRHMLKRQIAAVIVAYPATPMESARARFCLSAAHTKSDLDKVLKACDEVGDLLLLKFSTGLGGGSDPLDLQSRNGSWKSLLGLSDRNHPRWRIEDVIDRGASDVQLPLT